MNNFDLKKFLIENKLTSNSRVGVSSYLQEIGFGKEWTEEEIKAHIEKRMKKYGADTPLNSNMKTIHRFITDGICLLRNGGFIVSKLVEYFYKEQGYVGRNQVVSEHDPPISSYQKEAHDLFQKGDVDAYFNFLYNNAGIVFIHPVEDFILGRNGYTFKVPEKGTRYGNTGIELSDKVLPHGALDQSMKGESHLKRYQAMAILKKWHELGFVEVIDGKLHFDYSVKIFEKNPNFKDDKENS